MDIEQVEIVYFRLDPTECRKVSVSNSFREYSWLVVAAATLPRR